MTTSVITRPRPAALFGSWWARLGFESGRPVTGCPDVGCDLTDLHPIDVYCVSHERFLPFAHRYPGRRRFLVVNLVRTAVLGAFFLAALWNTSVPLDLLAAVAAGAVLVLPLRHHRTARVAAGGLWAVACVLGMLAAWTGEGTHRVIGTGVLWVLAAASALYAGQSAARYAVARHSAAIDPAAPPRMPAHAAAAVAAAVLVVPVTAGLALAHRFGPSGWVLTLPPAVTVWLSGATLAGALGVLLLTVIVGFLHGSALIDRTVHPLLGMPVRPRRLGWALARRSGGRGLPRTMLERFGETATDTAWRAVSSLVLVVRMLAEVLRVSAYYCTVAAAHVLNWAHRQAWIFARRVRKAMTCAGWALRDGASVATVVAVDLLRIVVAPVVLAGGAIGFLLVGVDGVRGYLVADSWPDLAVAVAACLATTCLLAAVCVGLHGAPFRAGLSAIRRTTELTLPQLVLLAAVGGWILGLPGTLGHGPVHVGALTVTLTILLVAMAGWTWRSRA
ncbi:hypothetical protein AB0M43_35555 [Longispora sp. NPDC051575]|uniref:hypothetical protein n=1 Tax=Longispora sp. NPDC051575 TaxID=3154943 RepID=UPI0034336DF8